jgi:hypothetical protein
MTDTPTFWLGRHIAAAYDETTATWTTACGLEVPDDGTEPPTITPHPACGRCMGAGARLALQNAARPKTIGPRR